MHDKLLQKLSMHLFTDIWHIWINIPVSTHRAVSCSTTYWTSELARLFLHSCTERKLTPHARLDEHENMMRERAADFRTQSTESASRLSLFYLAMSVMPNVLLEACFGEQNWNLKVTKHHIFSKYHLQLVLYPGSLLWQLEDLDKHVVVPKWR